MLLSAVSVLVVAQSSSEIPERLMNNPVLQLHRQQKTSHIAATWQSKAWEEQNGMGVQINLLSSKLLRSEDDPRRYRYIECPSLLAVRDHEANDSSHADIQHDTVASKWECQEQFLISNKRVDAVILQYKGDSELYSEV